jgi:hypothetical protein
MSTVQDLQKVLADSRSMIITKDEAVRLLHKYGSIPGVVEALRHNSLENLLHEGP